CQRISRYGECGGYCDLHALAGAAYCGGVVGILEFSGCVDFERAGRFWNYFFAAGGIDFAGGEQGWVRDGVCFAGRGHYLESGDLVFWLAGFQFAHFDRVDYWRGDCESVDVPENGHQRRGLGASYEHWKVAAVTDLHGSQFRARVERWTEGHGADHADSGGDCAYGLCFEPCDHAQTVG